jgi:superfamily II DNA or RNA helicase
MEEFRSGRVQALVSTLVIEVGIDVPNASIMVIDHCERYGLSQLHQLRGRIGRGPYESSCILFGKKNERIQTFAGAWPMLWEAFSGRFALECSTPSSSKFSSRELRLNRPANLLKKLIATSQNASNVVQGAVG